MRAPPRLLPLIAVAIGGVLAVKALSGVEGLPQLLSARPAAAEAVAAKRTAKKPAAQSPAAKPPASAAAPVCARGLTDLAREAGLSASEMQTLQSLQARRGQLDQRERDLDTQLRLLSATELKLDAKLGALNALKAQMQGLLGQGDQQTQTEVDRLVHVYEKMKPRDAAAVMAQLDDRVRIPVASKMKDSALAAVLAQMPTIEAKHLTEALARRFAPAQAQAQALAKAADTTASKADRVAAPTDATVGVIDPRKPARRPRRAAAKVKASASAALAAASKSPTG